MANKNQWTKDNPPCATCERLFDYNPCSLALGGKPPEGAKYEVRDIHTFAGYYSGYDIYDCPEYEPERERTADELDTDGCFDLLAAVVKRSFADYAQYTKDVKVAEHQAVMWNTRANLLRASIRQIEKFIPDRGQKQLARIRQVVSETQKDDVDRCKSSETSPSAELTAMRKRAEGAELLNLLSEKRIDELKKLNKALMRTLKSGKTLCNICTEKDTPKEMGCNNACFTCADKCICGKCVSFDKFEFGGGK